MGSIFISYRRGDSQGEALHLCEDLKLHFGSNRVFNSTSQPASPGKPGANIAADAANPSSPQQAINLVGRWHGKSPCVVEFQLDNGKNIAGDCISSDGFRHVIAGSYVEPNRIQITITRISPSPSDCRTTVQGSITIVDSNHIKASQEGWNGCDVTTDGATTDLERLVT